MTYNEITPMIQWLSRTISLEGHDVGDFSFVKTF